MAKKNEAKKTGVKFTPEVKSALAHINGAVESLKAARDVVKTIDDCPKKIIDRLTAMKLMVKKSADNITLKLTNLGAKAERVEAAKLHKADRIAKLLASQQKISAKIKELQK